MKYQLSWYAKRIPGPGRRALIGTERFELLEDLTSKSALLLAQGMEVRILPIEVKS